MGKASVQPLAIVGARDITRRGGHLHRPGRVFLRTGDPIEFSDLDAKGKKAQIAAMLVARYAIAAIALSADVSALDHTTLFGTSMSVIYLGCVLGHVFSPYLRFHGGKGIAVGFGAALGLWWPVAVGLLVVFLLFAVPTRYVSLGSVCAAASLPLWCLAFGFPPVSVVPVVAVAVVVIWAHRSNIRKLVNHDERRFSIHHEEEGGPR